MIGEREEAEVVSDVEGEAAMAAGALVGEAGETEMTMSSTALMDLEVRIVVVPFVCLIAVTANT